MRVKPIAFGILTIALFAGTVGVAMAAGAWQTTGRSGSGAGSAAGNGPGTDVPTTIADVADVKGWMPIGDVADATGIDLAEILAAFELPADTPPATPLKDLESDLFSVTNLRTWLSGRSATPSAVPGSGATVSP